MNTFNQLNKDLQATLEKMKALQQNQRESLDRIKTIRNEVEKNENVAPPKSKVS